ncbi:heavy metal translocating P-type ATPase [Catellicoccus marimammalium]|uniref:Cd(2+)-exporting ATPase n=1 Tax=Catellicoccus marimammalium M35/04/3 TaxID=1234409 RepID=K8ZBI0_9ENTE|nr:heavy metal translocating P-type ATPase [Catellicoccus marimammalium]EKU27407.1 Copper-translocating P-type ATPase [Catellicoccus marimammalium M35/04/3]
MNQKNKKRLGLILATIVLLVAVIFIEPHVSAPISFILYFLVYLLISFDIFQGAFKHIAKGEWFDENLLMIVATLGAFLIKEYHEGIMVMLLFQIGELLQSLALNKSRQSIHHLLDLQEDTARVKTENGWQEVPLEKIAIGSTLQVKAGERIPIDGVLLSEQAVVDTSAVTGEALARTYHQGEEISSGTLNESYTIELKTTILSENSTTSKMIELVQNAQAKKARSEQFIRKFAKVYTPIVLAVALLVGIIPPLVFHFPWQEWIYRALIFLVISCPCALVISVPLSFFAGIGAGSKNGVLFKGSQYIEQLATVKHVICDKTGTITTGKFTVKEVYTSETCTKEEALALSAGLEAYSNHPIAQSIVEANQGKTDEYTFENVQEIAGYGLSAFYNGKPIFIGNEDWMTQQKILVPQIKEAGTIVYLAYDGLYQAAILIGDTIKKSAYGFFSYLKEENIDSALVTGDRAESAESVARTLNIRTVKANCLPTDKVDYVEQVLRNEKEGEATAFIGDGMNDAPVIATADVGISLGGVSSQAAIDAADVVFMDNDLTKFNFAQQLSRKIMKTVKINIVFALVIKVLFLLLSTLGLVSMEGAIFADVGVTILTILYASRLLYDKHVKE